LVLKGVCDRVWDAETRIKLYKNGLMFQDGEGKFLKY